MNCRKNLFTIFFFFFVLSVASQQNNADQDSVRIVSLEQIVIQAAPLKHYNVREISGSLRLGSNLLAVPQNIQIINASALRNQFALNMTEGVTRNVSGTFREELHNGISSDIYSRGGYINPQRNGVDLRPILKGPLGDDISVIENIEFVKGPSSFMSSLGDPAGSYNIVTKKPEGRDRKTFTLSQGSFGLIRAEADLQGIADDQNKLLYRINLMGMHKSGFINYDNNDRILIAPSLKYNFDKNTSLTAEYIYQRLNYAMLSEAQISPYGFGSLPTDFSITDPSARPYKADDHSAFLTFDKKFSNNWSWTSQLANIYAQSAGAMFWVYGKNEENIDILDRYYVYDGMKYNTFSAQTFLKGNFKTGEVGHRLLAGIDFNLKHNKTHDTWNTATTIYPLSISNPVYANVINNNGVGGDFDSENVIDGVDNITKGRLYYVSPYVMDEISLLDNKLMLNAGLRLTRSDAHFNKYGEKSDNSDWVLSPRAGANYSITDAFRIYGLYDNSFMPQIGKTNDDKALKPIKGNSFELGLKNAWLSNAFSTTLSVYHITRSNTVINDPFTNEYYQTGQNKAKGIEFDIRGRILNGLYVTANYAYTDSKIIKDDKNPDLVGEATPNRVRHIQNTWFEYELPSKALRGFSISMGYQYLIGRSERFTTADPQKMKDLFRADAGIAYMKNKLSVNLMVNNVFNTHQYSTAWKKNDMYYWVQLSPAAYRCSITLTL